MQAHFPNKSCFGVTQGLHLLPREKVGGGGGGGQGDVLERSNSLPTTLPLSLSAPRGAVPQLPWPSRTVYILSREDVALELVLTDPMVAISNPQTPEEQPETFFFLTSSMASQCSEILFWAQMYPVVKFIHRPNFVLLMPSAIRDCSLPPLACHCHLHESIKSSSSVENEQEGKNCVIRDMSWV